MTIRRLLITRLCAFSPHIPYITSSSRYIPLFSNTKHYSSNYVGKVSGNILKRDKILKDNKNSKSSDKFKNSRGWKKIKVSSYSPVLLSKTFNIGNYKMFSSYNFSHSFYASDSSKKINYEDILSQSDDELAKRSDLIKPPSEKNLNELEMKVKSKDSANKNDLKKSIIKNDLDDSESKKKLKNLEMIIDLNVSEVKNNLEHSEMKLDLIDLLKNSEDKKILKDNSENVSNFVSLKNASKLKSEMCGLLFKRKLKIKKSKSSDSSKKTDSCESREKTDSCDTSMKSDSCDTPKITDQSDCTSKVEHKLAKENEKIDDCPNLKSWFSQKKTDSTKKSKSGNEPKKNDSSDAQKKIGSCDTLKKIDSSESPKKIEPCEASKKTNSCYMPKKTDSSDMPKKTDSSYMPKKTDSCDMPKKTDSCDMSKKTDSSDMPKKTDSHDAPKKTDSCDAPKKINPCDTPKKSDSCDAPKKTDSCDAPKKTDSCDTPKKSNSCDEPKKTNSFDSTSKVEPCELAKKNEKTDSYNASKETDSCKAPKKSDSHNAAKKTDTCDASKKTDSFIAPKKTDSCVAPKKTDSSDSKVEPCELAKKSEKTDDCPNLKSWFSRKKIDSPKKFNSSNGPKKTDACDAQKKSDSCDTPKKTDSRESPKKIEPCEPPKKIDLCDSDSKKKVDACELAKKNVKVDECPKLHSNYLNQLLSKKKCDENVNFKSSKAFSFKELCDKKVKLKKKATMMNYFKNLFSIKKRKYHYSSSPIYVQNYVKIKHHCVPTKKFFVHNLKHSRQFHTYNKTNTPIYTWISIPTFRFVSEKSGNDCVEEIKPQTFTHCVSNTNENENCSLVTKATTVCDNDKKKTVELDHTGRDIFDFEASLNVKGENSKQSNVDLTSLEQALADVIEKTSNIGKATGSKITYNYYLKHNALKERSSINKDTSEDKCKTATMTLKHSKQEHMKKPSLKKESNLSNRSCSLKSSDINNDPFNTIANNKTESINNKQIIKEKFDAYKLYTLMNGSPYKPEEVMKSISEFLARNTPSNQSYSNKLYNYLKNLVRFYYNGNVATSGVSMHVNNLPYKKFQKSRSYCTKSNKKLTVKKTDSLYQIFINRKLFKTITKNGKLTSKLCLCKVVPCICNTKKLTGKSVEKSDKTITKSLDNMIINSVNTISKSSSLDSNTKKETPVIDLHGIINNYQDIILKNPGNNDDHLYCRIVRKKISNKIEMCAIQYMNESELQALKNINKTDNSGSQIDPQSNTNNKGNTSTQKINVKTSKNDVSEFKKNDVSEFKKNDVSEIKNNDVYEKVLKQSSVITDANTLVSNIRSLSAPHENDIEDALQLLNSIKLSTFNTQTTKFEQQAFVTKPATTPPNQYGGRSNIAPTINQANLHTLLDYMYSLFKKSIDNDLILKEQKAIQQSVDSNDKQADVKLKFASLPADEVATKSPTKLPKDVEIDSKGEVFQIMKESSIENHYSIDKQKQNIKVLEHSELQQKQNDKLKSKDSLLNIEATKDDTSSPKDAKQNVLIIKPKKLSSINVGENDQSKDNNIKAKNKVQTDIDELCEINKLNEQVQLDNSKVQSSKNSKDFNQTKQKSVTNSEVQESKTMNDFSLLENSKVTESRRKSNEYDEHSIRSSLNNISDIQTKSLISKQMDTQQTSTKIFEENESKSQSDKYEANNGDFVICQSCSNERQSNDAVSLQRNSQICSNECLEESNNDMMRERCKITAAGKEEILNKPKSRSEALRSCTSDEVYFQMNKISISPKQESPKIDCLKSFDTRSSNKNLKVVGATSCTSKKVQAKTELKECNQKNSEEKEKCNITEAAKTCCDDEGGNKEYEICCLTKKYMIDKHNACCKRKK